MTACVMAKVSSAGRMATFIVAAGSKTRNTEWVRIVSVPLPEKDWKIFAIATRGYGRKGACTGRDNTLTEQVTFTEASSRTTRCQDRGYTPRLTAQKFKVFPPIARPIARMLWVHITHSGTFSGGQFVSAEFEE